MNSSSRLLAVILAILVLLATALLEVDRQSRGTARSHVAAEAQP